MVAFGGEVWVIGGFVGARVVPTVEAYDPALDRWRACPDLPVALHHGNAAVALGKIHVAGYLTGSDFAASGRVFAIGPGDTAWTERARMPAGTERGAAGAASDGERLWVVGGFRRGRAVEDVSEYDAAMDRWAPLPPLPVARDHLVAALSEGTLYAAGGRGGTIDSHTGRLDALPLANAVWASRAAMPTSRGGSSGALLGGRFYVMGGEGNAAVASGVFDRVESYDPRSDTWAVHAPMRTPRHGTGAAAVGARIFVPGGAARQGFGATDIHEAFTP